jgi:hypothetical protein
VLIGISGKKQSGKDTLADKLLAWFRGNPRARVQKTGFAECLKARVQRLFRCPYSCLYGTDAEKSVPRSTLNGYSGREVCQEYGTMIRKYSPDFWVRAGLSNAIGFDHTIYCDVRFPNEVAGIQGAGGVVIRLEGSYAPPDPHPSEMALDGYAGFDRVIPFGADAIAPTIELLKARFQCPTA